MVKSHQLLGMLHVLADLFMSLFIFGIFAVQDNPH